jgi:hypothetical protein
VRRDAAVPGYRPTKVPKQMVGIGEIEPIEHLQRELDTLRSQRRDAATLALCAGYAYDDGAIDEEDLGVRAGAAIRGPQRAARAGRDHAAAGPDVPGHGYQEEQVIRNDFDAVTGVNDALAGGDGGAIGTATEAQLVQAALSKRIELKSRRFEVEVVRQAARCFLYLDQRMILKPRSDPAARRGPVVEEAARHGRWQWFPIGPARSRASTRSSPEGGSMAAENVPQMRQDAGCSAQLEQNPHVDQRKLLIAAAAARGSRIRSRG